MHLFLVSGSGGLSGLMTGCRHAKRPTTSRETWNSLLGGIWAEAKERRRLLVLQSDADFIQMSEDIGRVLIDPIGSGALQLIPAIAPGEQSHREGERAARGQQIPDAVSDDDATAHANFQLLPCCDKQIGIGIREADVVTRDDRHVLMELEQLE